MQRSLSIFGPIQSARNMTELSRVLRMFFIPIDEGGRRRRPYCSEEAKCPKKIANLKENERTREKERKKPSCLTLMIPPKVETDMEFFPVWIYLAIYHIPNYIPFLFISTTALLYLVDDWRICSKIWISLEGNQDEEDLSRH